MNQIHLNAVTILGFLHLIASEVEGLTPSYTLAHKIALKVDQLGQVVAPAAPVIDKLTHR